MPRIFNRNAAKLIVSHEGVNVYRQVRGRYYMENTLLKTVKEIDYLFFRNWLNSLPDKKINKATKVSNKIVNLNVRVPASLKADLWTLAEYEGLTIQNYLIKALREQADKVGVPAKKIKKIARSTNGSYKRKEDARGVRSSGKGRVPVQIRRFSGYRP